jgi:hypothetical protein
MKKPELKKWKVSVVTRAFREVEAESLVEAGDKVAEWADNNPYELWNWFSQSGHTISGESVEEVSSEKTKNA